MPHEVTVIKGRHFPTCRHCNEISDERSSTLLSATDLALRRGEHRGKTRSLSASRDAIKPAAQLGGKFRERAHRQQQKRRDRGGGVGRFVSGHSGSSFGTAPLPWHQDRHDTRSTASRSPDDLLCNLRVSDQRGSRLPGPAALAMRPVGASPSTSARREAAASRLPHGRAALRAAVAGALARLSRSA
jgi:hypothetical protein